MKKFRTAVLDSSSKDHVIRHFERQVDLFEFFAGTGGLVQRGLLMLYDVLCWDISLQKKYQVLADTLGLFTITGGDSRSSSHAGCAFNNQRSNLFRKIEPINGNKVHDQAVVQRSSNPRFECADLKDCLYAFVRCFGIIEGFECGHHA